ncbi:hypothetical protein K2X14_11580 [Acetobacter sp. TBRC 12305]|uniref:Uncharacterized protein n=1 Tax=Acetobacter garciniae TaxID=2817435 RepID=A0A939HP01_9PROT|nr:hypothetical protein [Acetobacter garciniae]MBO1325349.1 hypothetical protein [Acetobacter garciniae]MBX0345479.1 hypothetical protein [Acetobacter garciniae]
MAVKIKSVGGVGLQNALKQLQQKVGEGAHVRVGFLEGSAEGDIPTAQIAAWNEFGTKTAPPRPFMRNTVAHNKDGWGKLLEASLKATGYQTNAALAMAGEKMVGQMQKEITATGEPANAPLTNLLKDRFPMGGYTTEDFLQAIKDLKKGATAPAGKPLVWSGNMLDSVASEVKGGPDES